MTVLERGRRVEVELRLPVHVVDTEGDFGVWTGETRGLGLHGVVARLARPLPCTCETTVQVELPDGSEVVAEALVAQCLDSGDGWTYRFVFPHLEPDDADALTSLLAAA